MTNYIAPGALLDDADEHMLERNCLMLLVVSACYVVGLYVCRYRAVYLMKLSRRLNNFPGQFVVVTEKSLYSHL